MLALICAAAAVVPQVPVIQPPRLRKLLPNGAVVLVEKIAGARVLAVGLYVSARSTPETPATHGYRHLIEHLIASGRSGQLDRKLETAGGFLFARTLREVMAFEVTVPPTSLKVALDATRDVIAARIESADLVRREVAAIREEGALKDEVTRASESAWTQLYGDRGLDAFGNLGNLQAVTPAALEAVRKSMFTGSNLVMIIAGDVDLDDAAQQASAALQAATPSKRGDPPARKAVDPVAIQTGFRALPVPGFRQPATAAALAAALAVAAELEGGLVVYTPSGEPGSVLLGFTPGPENMTRMRQAEPTVLFARGRDLARRWVRMRLSEPADIAGFRGMLLADAIDLRPETMLENLDSMTYRSFETAFRSLVGEAN